MSSKRNQHHCPDCSIEKNGKAHSAMGTTPGKNRKKFCRAHQTFCTTPGCNQDFVFLKKGQGCQTCGPNSYPAQRKADEAAKAEKERKAKEQQDKERREKEKMQELKDKEAKGKQKWVKDASGAKKKVV
ncbi:hypothetical protein NHQ30_003479 [Ciborinia camelliae]|nr:hypothetical protein NHQ30_003479 [Ciborinia camelliae]